MKPERMIRIETLYHEASSMPADRRADFLTRVCAGDEEVRREVESLLACEKDAESFMETPALQSRIPAFADEAEDGSAPLAGRSIGRYRVQAKAGAGGMGVVYRAVDTRLGRTVALKVLPPGLTGDPERVDRFVREAKAASALNHRNIITIFDIDRVDGIDCIAMEYVEGRTLQEIIAAGELAVADSLNVALQIVHALAAAHKAGIVHRDIKPANIMIAGSPAGPFQVKVLDFGLAKLSEPAPSGDALSAGAARDPIIGTVAYMSPEQAEGRPVDARSDLFSFGSVLYEMLSGRRAFPGESNLAILSAVLNENPAPLPGIPANLRGLVARCLQKDPNLRIQSAVELGLALEGCLPLSAPTRSPVKTIAVLPFANLSGDAENEYFGDGLAEEMIGALTKLPGLRVTARTSAFALRGRNLDIREIGARLNVEHVLEGSVRRSGNRVRVTAQLINATDGYQLWSERYDREMRDALEIQDEISRAIVETLRIRLAKDVSLIRRHTSSPEAYSLYLRGRHHQEKHTPEGYARAKQCFEQALETDPDYTLALLGLAEFYWQNAFYGFQYPRDALVLAKQAASRALESDDALAEAHALLGTLRGVADYDWEGAGAAFRRALELDPNSPYVLFRYANFYLWPQTQAEEASTLLERVLTVDPLWVLAHWVLGYYVYARKQYDRAVHHLHAVIELEPGFYLAHCVLGLVYTQQGMHREALQALERACALSPGNAFTRGVLAYALGKSGRREEAERIGEELLAAGRQGYVPAKALMFVRAGLDDAAQVIRWAEQSLEERDPMTVMNLLQEPAFEFVRSGAAGAALLRKIRLAH